MLLRGECSNVRRTALLKDLPPIHRWQPQTTPPEVVERILALAIEHPAYGCNRVEALLMLEGKRVSAITVQKILSEHALATRHNQRVMGAVAREDEAMAKARDEAVDPFHGLPIPQTLASKISSSAIERLAVRRHFKPKDQRPYRPIPDRPGITGGPWQMRPLSRGYAGSVSPSS